MRETAVLCLLFLTPILSCKTNQEPKVLTAKLGEDATLECYSSRNATMVMFKWSRPDLKSDGHVFFFRDGQTYEDYQHPSFRGRVEMRDPERKDGDYSVILRNVTTNDTGTYECYAGYDTTPKPELLSNITLKVEDSDQPGGKSGQGGHRIGYVVLGVIVFVVLLAVLVFLIRKKQERSRNSI